MNVIGIDIGSLTTKVALISDGKLINYLIDRSTYRFSEVGHELFNKLLVKNDLSRNQIDRIISTGYGRHSIDLAEEKVTEITAHARGVQYYFPDVRSIIPSIIGIIEIVVIDEIVVTIREINTIITVLYRVK